MKKNILQAALLFIALNCATCESEDAIACMVKSLKEKELLNDDFPQPSEKPNRCELLKSLTSTLTDVVFDKMGEEPSINGDCVTPKLKNSNFLSYLQRKYVIEKSAELSEDKARRLLKDNRSDLKILLDKVAKECDSDPNWAGVFDEELGVKNTTLAVLEDDYCSLSYLLDRDIIRSNSIVRNPHNIKTSHLNCELVIQTQIKEMRKSIRKEYEKKGYDGAKAECVLSKFDDRAIETTIGLTMLEKLDLDLNEKRRISTDLEQSVQGLLFNIIFCAFQ